MFGFNSLDDLACLIHGRDFDRFVSDDELGDSVVEIEDMPPNTSDGEL